MSYLLTLTRITPVYWACREGQAWIYSWEWLGVLLEHGSLDREHRSMTSLPLCLRTLSQGLGSRCGTSRLGVSAVFTSPTPALDRPLGLTQSGLTRADLRKRLQLVPEVELRPFMKGIFRVSRTWGISGNGHTGFGWTPPLALWTFCPVGRNEWRRPECSLWSMEPRAGSHLPCVQEFYWLTGILLFVSLHFSSE